MATLLKFVRWVVEKAAVAVGIVVLGLAAYGVWLFLRDNVDFDLRRNEVIMTLTGERAQIREALGDVKQRLEQKALAIMAERERVRQADRVIAQLQALESTWDRLVGNPEQQASNAEQLAKMQALREESLAKIAQLEREHTRTSWEQDGLELALGRMETRLQEVEAQKSQAAHYLLQAWDRSKVWIITALALYFFGPTLGRLFLYYVVAPVVMRGRPVRLTPELSALPEVAPSRVSLDLPLPPRERLWIKERFLQASDEGLKRRTRFLLDWRIPFTCFASGLVELIEMRNQDAGAERRVTLSNTANPHIELAEVTLPAGAALVLRPSFLVGALVADGQRLVIRRRWQILRWQAWVTLQFRFFEFAGPCRLIVAGNRGVRAERLAERAGGGLPARRTNQDATIGFTPNLDYRPVRAETFWGYYRGMNPLFDDLFAGRGIFLSQEISAEGEAGARRKFWSGLWGGVLKVFGL
jgi:hypothetical protein